MDSRPPHYYQGRVLSVESLARLLVSITVSVPWAQVELETRYIAPALRLLRTRPAFSLLMCKELHGDHFNFPTELVFYYLATPCGRNGDPSRCAIFGDSVSAIQPHCGATDPKWYKPVPFLPRLYVGDGIFSGIKIRPRQEINTSILGGGRQWATWGDIGQR